MEESQKRLHNFMGACKKQVPTPLKPEQKKSDLKIVSDNHADKAAIDRIKQLLSDKIKDPKLAKKAALIISEMLNKKS